MRGGVPVCEADKEVEGVMDAVTEVDAVGEGVRELVGVPLEVCVLEAVMDAVPVVDTVRVGVVDGVGGTHTALGPPAPV